MPGVSQKYPPEKRNSIFPRLHALGPLQGYLVNPSTGDMTVSAVSQRLDIVAAFIWDVLWFLDIIDQQETEAQQRTAAQDAQITALRQDNFGKEYFGLTCSTV